MIIKKEIIGYTWPNKKEAESAAEIVRDDEGLPKKEGDSTTDSILPIPNYTDEEGMIIDFWYWQGEKAVLGESKKIIINEFL